MLLVVATATFTGVKNEILLAAYVGTHVIHTRVYIRDHPSCGCALMMFRVGRVFLVVLLLWMEKGISDGNAWEGASVSQWQ